MFYDLNIINNKDPQVLREMVAVLIKLGFQGCALNSIVNPRFGGIPFCSMKAVPLMEKGALQGSSENTAGTPPLGLASSLRLRIEDELRGGFKQYTRLTVIADDPSVIHQVNTGNAVLKSYDIVAVQPTTDKAFQQICFSQEVDIICLDLASQLPFKVRSQQISSLSDRGICIELTVSPLLKDSTARRRMINNALSVYRVTKGRSTIISSAAAEVMDLRGPYDIINLASLFGLDHAQAKASISHTCRSLLVHAETRRKVHLAVLRVAEMPDEAKAGSDAPERAEQSTSLAGTKRKAI